MSAQSTDGSHFPAGPTFGLAAPCDNLEGIINQLRAALTARAFKRNPNLITTSLLFH
jgi:hypothetical protein